MWSKRGEVSFAPLRAKALQSLRRPTLETENYCDADPILLRSAQYYGEPAGRSCPICKNENLKVLSFIFGNQLGQYSGRIKSTSELIEMQTEYGEFLVRVVEVCDNCHWNFLVYSYLLGDGVTRKPPRKMKTMGDVYG